jgi:hypothetical protein
MPLDPRQTALLTDAQGRLLGQVAIDRIEGNRLFGHFTAGVDFGAVRSLFQELEATVNDQVFGEADRLAQQIDCLGLRLAGSGAAEQLALRDVQIMSVSAFCCEVPGLALTQFPRAVA